MLSRNNSRAPIYKLTGWPSARDVDWPVIPGSATKAISPVQNTKLMPRVARLMRMGPPGPSVTFVKT
jgi:hypothetical protein